MPSNQDQIQPPFAPTPRGRNGVVGILPEPGSLNSDPANYRETSPPPSARSRNGRLAEILFISHSPNTDVTDSNGQPTLLSVTHGERPRLLGLGELTRLK